MDRIAYKANCDDVLGRLRSLYERQALDRVFAYFSLAHTSKALAAYRAEHDPGPCEYPDPSERIAFWDGVMKERLEVEDDSIPSVYPCEFDEGLYGGMLGGEVLLSCDPERGWISSMVMPLLEDWSGFDALRLEDAGLWFGRYVRQLQIYADRSRDKFGISHLILIDGLNFVFELLGATATYLSLFEHPEMVRKAIELGIELNVKIQNTYFDIIPLLGGGTPSFFVQWVPGKVVSGSVDPFHMTSVGTFEEWGRAPVERIFERYDGGLLHIHGNGRHLLEAVCSVKGLKALSLGDDKGFPDSFEVRDEMRRRAGDTPLTIAAGFEDFKEGLRQHALPGGVLYCIQGAPGVDEVNRCMERVRAYRV